MDEPTLLGRLRKAVVFLFGRWEPPVWCLAGCRRLARGGAWLGRHRKTSSVLGLVLLVNLALGYCGYRYWQSRPKPLTVDVTAVAPEVTPMVKDARINPLVIGFAQPVAPLNVIAKEIRKGVTLKPPLLGRWVWSTERQLTFTPRHDWPIGATVEVRLAREGLVQKHVRLSTYRLEFKTPSFEARISGSEFYQDPVAADLKNVVVTFAFSHAVDDSTFKKVVKLHYVPSNKEEQSRDLGFTVSYDKLKSRAFVHSDAIPIPQKDAQVQVSLEPGARAARGGPPIDKRITDSVRVPGINNFFRISDITPRVVDNERLEPEQILTVETSLGVSNSELDKVIEAWTLPRHHPEKKSDQPYRWSNTEEISEQLLKRSKPLRLAQLASAKEHDTLHNFRFSEAGGRFIYVRIREGARSFGGYLLGETHREIVLAPSFPKQVKFLHSGALLSLGGDHTVTIMARDVPGLRFQIARVLPDQLHHFVSQSTGTFASPSFNDAIKPEHLADFHEETRTTSGRPGKPIYETLSLTRYLNDGQRQRGLFLITAQTWDPTTKTAGDPNDERLVLVTDLGVFVKRAVDHSREVFVQSIQTGKPVAGARVEVLGKNGLPVATVSTGSVGNARFPSLDSLKQEREPIVYRIQSGRDWSFLPYEDRDRGLDISRFDVGGVTEAAEGSELSAFVFSDRGVYRPGEAFSIAAIIRRQDWAETYKGLPLVATIVDPRGLEVKRTPLQLDPSGFVELSYQTQETSPTGKYTTNIHSARDGRPRAFLGATTVQVREFLPDTMRIKVSLNKESRGGWVQPEDLKAEVVLTNLYGTPRSDARVRVMARLKPGLPPLPDFPGYQFFDPLLSREPHEEKIPEANTDAEGTASFDLGLPQFNKATYLLSVQAEGFEGQGGGRSVIDEAHVVVSPLRHLVGWKADGDLSYLHQSSQQAVQLIAVTPEGKSAALPGLIAVLIERKYVSVLTRQENGTFKYQSVPKEVELSKKPLTIAAGGTSLLLATQRAGDFALVIRGGRGESWQRIQYTVAGSANLTRTLEKSGELQILLGKSSIAPGGTLQLEIKAPYAGSGLITIERDHVYAHKWFITETSTTVQTIEVPKGLEIGGYVAVAFVRSPKSDQILVNSLSHGVVPFTIDRERRSIALGIERAALAKPGQPYAIRIKSSKKARAVVFAVDEGILRVAGYTTPQPLDFFLKKRSLGVRTTQILDLLLPGQRAGSLAPGGDKHGFLGANLNPFKRRRDKPAVYWSGIIDVGSIPKTLTYTPPDSFNGTLRIMAVAASADAVGSADRQTIIRGDFVLTPSAPVVVAPGDEFEVPVTVANNVPGSGQKAKTSVTLTAGPELEVVGEKQQTLLIEEGRELSATFKVRARQRLGSAALTFVAALGGKQSRRTVELSVRPASPFLTTLSTGYVRPGQQMEVPITRRFYSEHQQHRAGISGIPLTLAHGLAAYLRDFPHLCTEQLSSQAVPVVVLGKSKEFGFTPEQAHAGVARFLERVWARQNADGSFGVWAANPHVSPLASVYTLNVLTEARERGHAVPDPLWKRGLDYLQKLARNTPDDLPQARVRSWAIYLLTRNAMVTTSYATAAQHWLDANHGKVWRQDLAGAYLGAAYQLLKKSDMAEEIMGRQKLGQKTVADYANYHDELGRDGQLLYLLSRHFPRRAAAVKHADIEAMVEAIAGGGYNTFSSAFTILALEALASLSRGSDPGGELIFQRIGKQEHSLRLPEGLTPLGPFSGQASALVFKNPGAMGRYYLVSQQGFDSIPEDRVLSQGLEVFREYLDANDKPVSTVKVGDELKVRFLIRALRKAQPNLAIVDLLPAGFEVVVQPSSSDDGSDSEGERSSSDEGGGGGDGEGDDEGGESESARGRSAGRSAPLGLPIAVSGTTFSPDTWDVREDRVVLYGAAGTEARTFIYAIKATNVGKFVVPPVQGASLYDRRVVARGRPGVMTVTKAK